MSDYEIDWENPLTEGLQHLAYHDEKITFDYVAGDTLVEGSTVSHGRSINGGYSQGAAYDDGTSFIKLPVFDCSSWVGVSCLSNITFEKTTGIGYPGLLTSVASGATSGNFSLTFQDSDRTGSHFLWNAGVGGVEINGLRLFLEGDLGKSIFVCSTYKVASGEMSIYQDVDGVSEPDVFYISPTVFEGTVSDNHIGYYTKYGSGRSLVQPIHFTAVFNRDITREEATAIRKNPRQLVRRKARTIADDSWYATLFPVLGGISAIINTVTEINNSQSLSKSKVKTLSQAIETNLSYPFSTSLSAAINQTQETDIANSLLKLKSKTINTALESDSALSVSKSKVKTILQAIESDFSNAISTGIVALINSVSESNLSIQLSKSKLKTINQANETNTASTLISVIIKQIGGVSETNTAQSLNKTKIVTISGAIETDNAIALLTNQVINIGQTLEADVALSISIAGAVTTIHPKRIFIVDAKDRVYSVEPKNRSYKVV